jgi:iron complex outermembrane receptor protein
MKDQIVITASIVGYKKFEEKLNLQEDIKISIHLPLSPFKTDEIVVTANQRIQNIQEISNSAIILGRNELNLTSRSDFEQALKDVPGVEVYDENISIRGSDGFDFGVGSRTLMLLDGIPLMSGDQGGAKFDLIPNSEISRVEIVKGSGSALYGSSAIGGVINLISNEENTSGNGTPFEYDFSLESGYYTKPKYKAWQQDKDLEFKKDIEGSFRFKGKNYGISLAGDYDYDPSYRVFDDNKRWSVYSNFYYYPTENYKMNLTFLHQANNSADWVYWNSLDSATYPPTDTDMSDRIFSNKSMLSFSFQAPFSNNFSNGFYSVKTSLFYTNFYNNLAKNDGDFRESRTLSRYVDLQGTKPFLYNFISTFGLTWNGNLVNSASFGDRKQNIFAAYLQNEYKPWEKLTLTLGARFDVESAVAELWNEEFSPKFGINYKISNDFSLRGSVGKGFRAPTVAERFAAINYQGFSVVENLDLKPETSWNLEFGGNAKFTTLILPMEFDGTFFWNTFKELIEPGFIDENYTLIKFQNITNARIPGMELNLRTLLSENIVFSNSFTYIDPYDTDLNEVLKFRSRYYFNSSLLINYNFSDIELLEQILDIKNPIYKKSHKSLKSFDCKISYRYSSKVEEIDNKLVLQVKDAQARVPIHVVDLYAGINFEFAKSNEMSIGLNVYNLLNHYYTYMVGNLAPTRFVGLSFSMNY